MVWSVLHSASHTTTGSRTSIVVAYGTSLSSGTKLIAFCCVNQYGTPAAVRLGRIPGCRRPPSPFTTLRQTIGGRPATARPRISSSADSPAQLVLSAHFIFTTGEPFTLWDAGTPLTGPQDAGRDVATRPWASPAVPAVRRDSRQGRDPSWGSQDPPH